MKKHDDFGSVLLWVAGLLAPIIVSVYQLGPHIGLTLALLIPLPLYVAAGIAWWVFGRDRQDDW